jgi:hypothetical protein
MWGDSQWWFATNNGQKTFLWNDGCKGWRHFKILKIHNFNSPWSYNEIIVRFGMHQYNIIEIANFDKKANEQLY